LGCVLYQMLSGEKPFGEGGTLVVLWGVRLKEPRPLCEVSPSVPAALSDLVSRLLAKSPADRPAAREVADALDAIAKGSAAAAPARRPRSPWGFALAVALGLVLLLGAYLLHRNAATGTGKGDPGAGPIGDEKPPKTAPGKGTGELIPAAKHTLNGG